MKRCKRCGENKPLNEFYAHAGCRDGVRPECKACNLAAKAWRHSQNPEPARERTEQWRRDNPDRYAANQARFRESGGKKISDRRSYLKRTYGITLEEHDSKLDEQGGVCAICRREPNPNISLHVDHDHETGELRGLLCFPCNQAIGSLQEDPALLEAALRYLERHDPDAAPELDTIREVVLDRVRRLPPPASKQPA